MDTGFCWLEMEELGWVDYHSMLSPWKNMGDGLRGQAGKELCLHGLLSSVSHSGFICMFSWEKKARRNLNFKSQRNVKNRGRRPKPRWESWQMFCDNESGLDSHPGAACPQATAWSKEGDWFYVVLAFSRASFWGHSGTVVGSLSLPRVNSGFCWFLAEAMGVPKGVGGVALTPQDHWELKSYCLGIHLCQSLACLLILPRGSDGGSLGVTRM